MARAAGIRLTWEDFADLSAVVPLLSRIYPNGLADVNHFRAAGGMQFLIGELLDAGFLHADVRTVWGNGGLRRYLDEPFLIDDELEWRPGPRTSGDRSVLAPATEPFSPDGGLKLLTGNLGRAVIKVSAVRPERQAIEAPAVIFDDQSALQQAFQRGELERDFVAVVRFQGPRANGMPELHKLTPTLGILQDRGFKVALVTDGRMSGASGKVPAAIHVTPEAADRGPLAKIHDGDLIRLDARAGRLEVVVDEADWAWRTAAEPDLSQCAQGLGRELFANFRAGVSNADAGAAAITFLPEPQAHSRAEADALF
jgi:phosphogluconate dehydratase